MCEDCNKYHKKFANAHEVRRLLKEELETRQEKPKIPPRPRQRPVPAKPTQTTADMAQFITKPGEAGERISGSGLTDTADNSQATITSTAEKERSSYSTNELKTTPVLQRDQGDSPNEQNKIWNMSEIRKPDSNVEKIEPLHQIVEIQIQAAEKNRRWKQTLCPSDSFIMAVAIEIDTNYTNYSFSRKYDFQSDPLKITTPIWRNNTGSLSASSLLCVLFDKYRKFHSFGSEAEDNYSTFAGNGEHKDYYFFRGIKMGKLELKRDLMLEDEMGKTMYAMDVFSECIKFLRKHCLEISQRNKCDINDGEIRWVLVVPGIFNDASELFLREAAEKAGINCPTLRLVLKPEAASIYCQNLPVHGWKKHDGELRSFAPHYKYLICDAGDVDINVTAHEVMEDGYLKAFYKTSCNNCGSYFINIAIREFLASVVGNDVMDEFQATQIKAYNELFREFETLNKSYYKIEETKVISVKLPFELLSTFERARGKHLKDHIQKIPLYKDKLRFIGDKLSIDWDVFSGFLMEICDVASRFLKSLFNQPQFQHLSTVIMVGNFSEFAMLQDVLMKALPNKRFIIPVEPSSAVLQGAVIFGHSIE